MANEFVARNGLIALDNSVITGSLNVTNGITGSLLGTSSWAVSSSRTITSSYALSASNALTSSYTFTAVSSSYALSGSYVLSASNAFSASNAVTASNASTSSYAFSASNAFNAVTASHALTVIPSNQIASGSVTAIVDTNLTQLFKVTSGSATYILVSGSGNVGINTTNPQARLQVSGSENTVNIKGSGSALFSVDGTAGRLFQVDDSLSGSLFSVNTAAGLPIIEAFSDNTVRIGQFGRRVLFVSQSSVGIGKESLLNGLLDISGSVTITGSLNVSGSITGSLFGTSSWALNVLTASFVSGTAASASYALSASNALTSSFVLNAVSASYALSASNALTASFILNAVSASYALSASNVQTASIAFRAISSSYADFANTASSADDFIIRGSVGIGTTATGYKVNIVGSTNVSGAINANGLYSSIANIGNESQIIVLGTQGSYNAGYELRSTNSPFASRLGMAVGNGDTFLSIGTTSSLSTVTYFKADGNVGIGTTNPVYKFDLVGGRMRIINTTAASSPGIWFGGSGGDDVFVGLQGTASTASFGVYSSGAWRFTVQNNGNVGIGTVTPTLALLQVQGNVSASSFTGSLFGSSSYALTSSFTLGNVASASYALSASNALTASFIIGTVTSASYALSASNAQTASFVLTASYANFANTASSADNFIVRNTLTATTIVAQVITSSTNFITGSTQFGSLAANTHQFTGSVSITGSLAINANNPILTITDSDNTVRYAGIQLGTNGGTWFVSNGDSTTVSTNDLWFNRASDGTDNRVRIARDTYTLSVYTGSNENVILNANGNSYFRNNVGIGTTAPSSKLDVIQSGSTAGITVSGGTNPQMRATDGTVTTKIQIIPASLIGYIGTETNHPLGILTNNTTRIHANADGNIGIGGLTSPTAILHVSSSTATSVLRVDTAGSAGTLFVSGSGNVGIGTTLPSAQLEIKKSAQAIPNILLSGPNNFNGGDFKGLAITNYYSDGTGTNRQLAIYNPDFLNYPYFRVINANINQIQLDAVSGSGGGGLKNLYLNNTIYITSGSNVGIGVSAPTALLHVSSSTATSVFRVDTAGSANTLFVSGSGNVGIGTATPIFALDVNGTGRFTSIIETSTRTLKDNIQSYPTEIETFKQLEPVTFTWKETGKDDVGLIAEDVEKLFPEFVSKTEDGDVTGINYGKLSTIFINVLKQQQARIELLEEQIKKLTS